jgi:hypothetical protein
MIRMMCSSLIFTGHVENLFDKQSNDSFENFDKQWQERRKKEGDERFNKLLHTPIEHEKKKKENE